MSRNGRPPIRRCLTPRQHAAALALVGRVRAEVPAELWRAVLFGSHARGEARPDSDVDVLLVFRRLPPEREPQAGMAEEIAAEVARETGVPVTAWSVSLADLERGGRTPMLVDALDDGVPLWPEGAPPCPVAFTPEDALWCASMLDLRVREGSREVEERLREGDPDGAARRARDDVVRLCTAALLLAGETRPRRGDAVRRFVRRFPGEVDGAGEVLRWAAGSFGLPGAEDDAPVPPPPGGIPAVARAVGTLRRLVARRGRALASAAGGRGVS